MQEREAFIGFVAKDRVKCYVFPYFLNFQTVDQAAYIFTTKNLFFYSYDPMYTTR